MAAARSRLLGVWEVQEEGEAAAAVTPVMAESATVLEPTVRVGDPVLGNAIEETVPDRAAPLESVQDTFRPSIAVAVDCICVWFALVVVEFKEVSCSIDARLAVCCTICELSIGELGSWFASCVTSSLRNSWLLYCWFAASEVLVPLV